MIVWAQDLDEREIPPMSAEMFSALVTARLRPLDGIEIRGGKGLALQLRVKGQDATARLERAYQRYRANPELLSPVVEQLIHALLSGERAEQEGTAAYAEIAPLLYPRFMTAQQWRAKRDAGLRPVIRPLVQDLGVALVIDRGSEIEFVQLDAIPGWGVDAQQAYDTAIKNLEGTASVETIQRGQGDETLLIDHHADGYAAARALLASRMRDWQARIQGELVLAIPTRDLLLGFAREHPAFDDLRAQVQHDAQTQDNGLFSQLLTVRDGALELLAL
ncbi:MAG: DUF1444 family protein [Chloroflexi bacterium]|nr:DUF1444 family protein [Chloroflexota bacterium]